MSSPESRRIDELVKRVNALAAQLAALLRPKPTSWVQNSTGGGAILVRTPSTGISAATLSGSTYTLGAALCQVFEIVASGSTYNAIATGESVLVCNMVPIAIRPNTLIQTKQINDQYVVDVEPCSVTYSTTPSPEET